jgi:cytochrome c oxidase subunit 2
MTFEVFTFLAFSVTFCDVSESWQMGLQDPATPVMEGMLLFHDYLMMFLIAIGIFVTWMLTSVYVFFGDDTVPGAEVFAHDSVLETVWTLVPAMLLIMISIPSFALLYSLDELITPEFTLKVIGHQWYWSYEYNDCIVGKIAFDSYMVPTADLTVGAFRLLEVDNRAVLPIGCHVRVLVTAADVLHSWSVPAFGIKIDACPGRLSQGSLYIKRAGVYYGQCSEICGVNHGFMPVVVRALSLEKFAYWTCLKK